jgi:amidophosphoribosyltransferase
MTSQNEFRDQAPWDIDADDDKLREECGIFGVLGVRDAAATSGAGAARAPASRAGSCGHNQF